MDLILFSLVRLSQLLEQQLLVYDIFLNTPFIVSFFIFSFAAHESFFVDQY